MERAGPDVLGLIAGQGRWPLDIANSAARRGRSVVAVAFHGHTDAGIEQAASRVTWLHPGEVAAKVGADGVYGVALPTRGLGLALKVEDGDNRSAMVALVAILAELGFDPDPRERLSRFASFPVLDTRGETVGSLHAHGSLALA